jgi:hypothetical protein
MSAARDAEEAGETLPHCAAHTLCAATNEGLGVEGGAHLWGQDWTCRLVYHAITKVESGEGVVGWRDPLSRTLLYATNPHVRCVCAGGDAPCGV